MTVAYAKLSMRAGFLAGMFEDYTVMDAVRRMAWDLTPEHLVILESLALHSGMPEHEVAIAVEQGKRAAAHDSLIAVGLVLQEPRE